MWVSLNLAKWVRLKLAQYKMHIMNCDWLVKLIEKRVNLLEATMTVRLSVVSGGAEAVGVAGVSISLYDRL